MPEACYSSQERTGLSLFAQIRARMGIDDAELLVESEGMLNSARDFLAFGTVRWMLRDLTIAMGHSDSIDYESLTRELLAAAHSVADRRLVKRDQSASGGI